jgi:hypothetical protein
MNHLSRVKKPAYYRKTQLVCPSIAETEEAEKKETEKMFRDLIGSALVI